MTGHDWVSLGQWVVVATIGALVWIFSTGRVAGTIQANLEAKIDKVNNRMDQAGELLSDLTGKIQAMPTQDAMTAVWRELDRLREDQRESAKHRAQLSERLSFLEGQRGHEK